MAWQGKVFEHCEEMITKPAPDAQYGADNETDNILAFMRKQI